MGNDCIFCRIARGEAPATVVYQDDDVIAFEDLHPHATTHLLVIPKQHITSLSEAPEADPALLGKLLQVAARVAHDAGLEQSGYRVVTNVGPDSGQTVFHLHFHVLGGNPLRMKLG